jgi:hypothetical protein
MIGVLASSAVDQWLNGNTFRKQYKSDEDSANRSRIICETYAVETNPESQSRPTLSVVIVLASSAVDRVFEPRSGQTKDYKTCIRCFSAKHAALRRKIKDWLVRNQDNVSE